MRDYIYLLLVLTILSGCTNTHQSDHQEAAPLNILFIAVDDLRPELGCYNVKNIHSPSIDRLAKQAMIFERAYCQVPVCGASRASLLSGLYPTAKRFTTYFSRVDEDAPGIVPLPAHFKNNGYFTKSIGKIYHDAGDSEVNSWNDEPFRLDWHKAPDDSWSDHGWRNYLAAENDSLEQHAGAGWPFERINVHDTAYNDGKYTQKALEFLDKYDQQQPFFLAVGYLKPHLPFNAPEKYWDLYDSADYQLPPNYNHPDGIDHGFFTQFGELRGYHGVPKKGPLPESMARQLIHGYKACVSYIDAQIGLLQQKLEEKNLADNTVIIIWGDHGFLLGENGQWSKHTVFEKAIHVPLIIKYPSGKTGRTSEIVEFVDIYPTLCEIVGIPLTDHLQGKSFLQLLKNGKFEKDYAYSRYGNAESIRYKNFHYAYLKEPDSEMMFDLSLDQEETENLAGANNYQDMKKLTSHKLDSIISHLEVKK
ncbi:MAG: sulfatase [Cyclobacteriaceae bacterium]|nr:sulfatase [Cyclobacteriaceae bacterium]